MAQFFVSGNLSPKSIIEKLQIYYGKMIIPGETLLFFDEIQACSEALTALRFFYEQIPKLHVVATGSLLEFALQEIPSYGVGRIQSLFMYPLSFYEFLIASHSKLLADEIDVANCQNPLSPPLHRKAIDSFKLFSILGGLPEVVQTYLDTQDLQKCFTLVENLLLGYQDDFTKYKTKISQDKLRDVLIASGLQAGGKFVYSRINPGVSPSGYDQALSLLELSGLVYRVYKTSANGIPLGGEVNRKSFKVIPFDVGIFNRLLNLTPAEIIASDPRDFVHIGSLAEVACGTELVANTPPAQRPFLYYWSREERGSHAEVDYVIQKSNEVVPIEVKAGTRGKMQSLYYFLSNKRKTLGIRSSLENFSQYQAPEGGNTRVQVIPLYAIGRYGHR